MKRSPRPRYRPTKVSIFVALASPASPTPPHLPSPPLFRPPRGPVRAYRKGTNGLTTPQYPPLSELRFLSHNLQKKPIVSSQILRHLNNDYDIRECRRVSRALGPCPRTN